MGKVLLKALLEIRCEIEIPVSQRKQVQLKRIFFVTELFSAQWKTVSGRQVSAEAGGELSIRGPVLYLKDKKCFIAIIHNAKLDLDMKYFKHILPCWKSTKISVFLRNVYKWETFPMSKHLNQDSANRPYFLKWYDNIFFKIHLDILYLLLSSSILELIWFFRVSSFAIFL